MRFVAQRTGLTPDVLRAWERRYKAVAPVRSPGGQRHYSTADLERLTLLARAADGGRQIGQLVPLTNDALASLIEGDERRASSRRAEFSDVPAVESFLSTALVAVEEFDAFRLEQTLRSAVLRLPADAVLDQVIGPLLFTIGSLWHQGLLRPANEHLASATIRRVLVWMTEQSAPESGAPVIVVATPISQVHELGAMLAATTAAGNGWRVVYLGANLPADELARAVKHARADAIALSIVYPENDPAIDGELRALRAAIPAEIPIVIGGSGSPSYAKAVAAIGATAVTSLAGLRQWLRTRASTVLARPTAR
jgi:methylmalonyl-CoA mutase cobalamin-binding subunit